MMVEENITFTSFAKVGHSLFVCLILAQMLSNDLQFKFIPSAQLCKTVVVRSLCVTD
jgi:hypothetical protein